MDQVSSYNKWISFNLACRLRVLNQGSLATGNTQQNKASLLASCITNANGAQTFAKWNVLRPSGSNAATYLLVMPSAVPGYVPPVHS